MTINPIKNDKKCFQYALTVALNYQSIKKTLKEYQKLILLLINRIVKRNIFHQTHQKDWKKVRL